MPSRLIREPILTSARVERLSLGAEVFYRRLMSKVDDYGRFDGRLSILRAALYPLRLDGTKEADCRAWLGECIDAGLITAYQVHGRSYLVMHDTRWKTRSESKYPPLPTTENNCEQVQTPVALDVVLGEDVGVLKALGGAGASPPSRKQLSTSKREPGRRATRIADDWQPSDKDREHARDRGFDDAKVDDMAQKFRDYHLAIADHRGLALDWHAKWRTWVGHAVEFERNRQPMANLSHDRPELPLLRAGDHE